MTEARKAKRAAKREKRAAKHAAEASIAAEKKALETKVAAETCNCGEWIRRCHDTPLGEPVFLNMVSGQKFILTQQIQERLGVVKVAKVAEDITAIVVLMLIFKRAATSSTVNISCMSISNFKCILTNHTIFVKLNLIKLHRFI